jgi:PAS domain S-box-containing protein
MNYTYPKFGERDLLVSYFPIEGPHGVNRVASVIRDITERKRTEDALRESEKRYRALFEGSRDAIYVTTREGEIVDANQSMIDLFGYCREEIIGLNARKTYVDPEDRRKFQQQIEREGFVRDYEIKLRKKDGAGMECLLTATVRRADDGTIVGYQGIIRDITEHKQVLNELRTEKQRFQTLSENAPFGMVMIDKAGAFRYINPKFRELFGYDLNDVPDGKTWFRKAYPDTSYRHDVISTWINDLESSSSGEKRLRTFTVTCEDGTEKIINFIPVQLGTGENLMACEDITESKRAEEALRESEERYRTILENVEDGYYEVDLPGNLTFFNDSLCRMLGYSREEMIGMGNQQYTDEENRKKLFQAFNEVYRTGKPTKGFGWEVFRKDGMKLFGEVSVSLIKDSKGQPIGFRGIARDITERKRVEEEYRTIINTAMDGFWIVDMRGRFLDANDAYCRLIGYSRDELLTMRIQDVEAVERPEETAQRIQRIMETGGDRFETRHRCKDGRIIDIEVSVNYMEADGGRMVVFLRHITERKRMEEALRQAEEKYRSIFENAIEGIFQATPEGRYISTNPALASMYGYESPEELINTITDIPHQVYVNPDDRSELFRLLQEKGVVHDFETQVYRKDREVIWISLDVRYVCDSQGRFLYYEGFAENITERKRTEQERLNLEEQLRQSQKMEAIGRLAGGIAHDFNNLLTVIRGYSQLSLMDLKESNPLKGNIEEIQKASQRAADLTRQLLAFSRRQVMEMKVLDLNILLKDLDKMLRRVIGEDIELLTLLSDDLWGVKADPGQIEQVIMNFAVNAKDAMPSGGRLTIETANVELDEAYARAHIGVTPGHYVMLSASDSGVGMSQEIKERAFEPFFTTKEKSKGTGLGLSTVYGIVKQCEGNIWVYSEPGKGTTFKIYLPRVDEPLEEPREKIVGEELLRGSETVLVVEDEEKVRKLTAEILGRQGYRVLEASHGDEALLIHERYDGPIHLVLVDVVMPGMNGSELAKRLAFLRPETKILYMSGYTDNAIVHHGVLEKGVNYVQKPFTMDALARKVREVLNKDPSTSAIAKAIDNMEGDKNKC